MKNKGKVKILSLLLAVCFMLSACGQIAAPAADNTALRADKGSAVQNAANGGAKTDALPVQTAENAAVPANADAAVPTADAGAANAVQQSTVAQGSVANADALPASAEQSAADAAVSYPNAADITIPSASPAAENGYFFSPAAPVPEAGTYNEGVALVKYIGENVCDVLSSLCGYSSAKPLYKGSDWYVVELAEGAETTATVTALRESGSFAQVDYDYVMAYDANIESLEVAGNPDFSKQTYMNTLGITSGWGYIGDKGTRPGGSSDVVIAVIDTGVDYNHLDLRRNIWVNTAEIPGNGIDDDGNGYVDDVYGWNFVADTNDPMDDNGHGTHVAGIVAAENNLIGGVGVAYNCKVMCIKAGNSSGYFNNSDIAEAVQYAYMNGASVINMSFGGYSISMPVEEALMNAYNSCVLVAAAGNDGRCNQPGCSNPNHAPAPAYPAALPYVIGVMSVNADGSAVSGFSNYDHRPFNSYEYEVYAVGENVFSTWPNNKFAALSGTSMAAPTVSGIAALLRSAYPDRNVYSTKYLQSQIVNTGTIHPFSDSSHSVANAYEALTKLPKPDVKLYDYYIFDSAEFSSKNNGDGIIDAGETIHIAIELQNRGGVASGVTATLDTIRNNDPSLTDPYFTIVNSSVSLNNIGTYSVRDGGKLYRDGRVYDVENCFTVVVSDSCPNDYLSNFNVSFKYRNGLNEKDKTVYSGRGGLQLSVSSGEKLPAVFTEDTTLTAGKRYIVSHDVIIPEGVTVNVDPGVEIQFYENTQAYYDSLYNSPEIIVYGTLNFNGTEDNMIYIHPSELFADFICPITKANFNYTQAVNICVTLDYGVYNANHSNFIYASNTRALHNFLGGVETVRWSTLLGFEELKNSYIKINLPAATINTRIITAESSYFDIQLSESLTSYIENGYDNVFVTEKLDYARYNQSSICIKNARNNLFMTANNSRAAKDCVNLDINSSSNTFLDAYGLYYDKVIMDFYGPDGKPKFDINDKTGVDLSKLWPFVTDVKFTNAAGEEVTTLGKSEFNVRIEFNRPVSSEADVIAYFGSIYPYADYSIKGGFTSDTVWEGTYTLKAFIEDGTQYMTVKDVSAADDGFKSLVDCRGYYSFVFDTVGAMSMSMQAEPTDSGIKLGWAQDDYDTLMGYNVYRSTEKDGNYTRINPAILLATDESFVDENAEPGVTYWYTFTVVLSDFSESAPAGKVSCTATDTLAPTVYHTPVNQGYENNNLVISCTASDNIEIACVTLYYRTCGDGEWKSVDMSRVNDRYNATVFGSELTTAGIEYYIVASDGRNEVNKGSADAPYYVVVKDASALSVLGDVDGDGIVTTKDALMIMQCINGDLIMTDDQFKRADLNRDGVLSSVEALRILQYINGNVNVLEM